MQIRFMGLLFALAGLAVLPVIFAQTAPPSGAARVRAAAAVPDFSGLWGLWMGPNERSASRQFDPIPPMTPAAAARYRTFRDAVRAGGESKNLLDPIIKACAPPGPTRLLHMGRPFEILQLPDRVIILHEYDHWVRHIWIDGRGHPEEVEPTWMGHSIGHYDGDTLVVDTVGFNDKTWLDTAGNPHSESLHVIERFRRVNQGTLEVAVVYEDPEVYTKPITGKIIFGLSPNPDGVILEWVDCEDRINELLKSDPCEMGVWELRGVCEERRRDQPAPSTRQRGNPPSAY